MNTGLADQLAFAEEARRVGEELARARLAECAALRKRLAAAEKAQAAAERRAAEGELVRRQLHNTILVRALLADMFSHSSGRYGTLTRDTCTEQSHRFKFVVKEKVACRAALSGSNVL